MIFDKWAKSGRAEIMESEHSKTVNIFLDSIIFNKPFTFLDIGCGNGWVVRKIASLKNCKKAVGIDKSKNMIENAELKKNSIKEYYIQADIQSWNYNGKFDYIFSMESLYYVESIKDALKKIFGLLKPGGNFFCGTDFYLDNKATTHWAKQMDVPMHLHSRQEWKQLLNHTGFKTKSTSIKNPSDKKKWRREHGTLFLIGTKQI